MYSVKYIDGNWHIIDSAERTVFTGNKQQIEDWLDAQESIVTSASTAAGREVRQADPRNDAGFHPGVRFETP